MSPNGHALPPEVVESQRTNPRETIWPVNRSHKETMKNKTTIIRRASLNEKQKLLETCGEKEGMKKPVVLPDVLPINVKLLGSRSQQYNRPAHLSLSPMDKDSGDINRSPKSPPASPPKSPPRGSPFTPLRTTNMSSPTVSSTSTFTTVPSPAITSTPTHRFSLSTPGSVRTSPATLPRSSSSSTRSPSSPRRSTPSSSPVRASPTIKPSLSPNSSLKLSSSKPSLNSSSTISTPPHISPVTSPLASPKCSSPQHSLAKTDYPKVVEGLQMIQRTEVVLRINTTTTDAASQTDKEELPPTPLPTRKKLQEEIECEKLAEDLLDHLPTSDRLKELLVPLPEHKKPTDYVQGLFRVDVTLKPRPANSPFRSRNNTPSNSPPPTLTTAPGSVTSSSSSSSGKLSLSPNVPSSVQVEPTSPLSGSSLYFTTSEPKAKLLTRYSQDMNQCHIVKNTKDLSQKKEELVNRLDKKLEVLRGEQLVVDDECRINDKLGENVELHINRMARPHEVSKFKLHVEEVGKITSLLLSLSGRLARAENALMGMADEHPEKRILEAKRDKLLAQLEEAKHLKESIDRRSVSVSNFLYRYLNSEEYADYDHFINMKAKLIMDSKEISDKIKLGEEQLLALKETLIVTD